MLNLLRTVKSNRLLFDQSTSISRVVSSISSRYYSSDQKKSNKGVLYLNLMDENDKFIFKCTIDEAKRYAKKHDLLLVNYEGPNKTLKTQQMQVLSKSKLADDTNNQLTSDSKTKIASGNKKVTTKRLILKDSISDHDLNIRMKKIANLLYRGNQINLVINGFKTDTKMSVLEKIKKKFVPHISFKQVINNSTQIKLRIASESTFAQHYEENYKTDEQDYKNDEEDLDEEDLMKDDLDDMISDKSK